MSTNAHTKFKITNIKLYVPIVTLSSKDNVKQIKLLEEGYKDLFIGINTKKKKKKNRNKRFRQ